MDEKGRTYAFKPCNKEGKWQVLVFERGKKGVQRFHSIQILNVRGTEKIFCNCPRKWYAKGDKKNEPCPHEIAFMEYMQKLIDKGVAK